MEKHAVLVEGCSEPAEDLEEVRKQETEDDVRNKIKSSGVKWRGKKRRVNLSTGQRNRQAD